MSEYISGLADAKECRCDLCSEVAFSLQVSEVMPSPGKFNCFRNFASVLFDLER